MPLAPGSPPSRWQTEIKLHVKGKCSEVARLLAGAIAAQLPWLEANTLPGATLTDCRHACEAALGRLDILQTIERDAELKTLHRRVTGRHWV
jgi:hypothetical protein